ncbi:diguanylate cyclase (GGDEF) domain-containing protein [Sphaerotilus natans]|nr:diguanylate cyclase (GGDEF) domain-containing protein [Sphaerotilus natans]
MMRRLPSLFFHALATSLLWLLGGLMASVPALASTPVDLSSWPDHSLDLTESMQVLQQPAAAVSADAAVLGQPGWRPATLAQRDGLWKNATVWLTGLLTNASAQPQHRLIVMRGWRIADLQMQVLDPASGQILQQQKGGLERPQPLAAFAGTDLVLPLTLAPGETVRLLLRLQDRNVPPTVVKAWPESLYRQHEASSMLLETVTVTAAAVLGLLMLSTRRSRFCLLGGWVLAVAVFDAAFRGQLWAHLLRDHRDWLLPLIALSGALTSLLFSLASLRLLRLCHREGWSGALLLTGMLAVLCALAVPMVDNYAQPLRAVNLLVMLGVLLWPLAIWRRPLVRPELRAIQISLTLCFVGMQSYLLLMHSHSWLPVTPDLLKTLAWIDYMAMLCALHICAVSWQVDRRRRHLELEFLALNDALTGLPNRVQGIEQLQQALRSAEASRSGSGVGVLCMDLDGFKQINDTYGHALGDQLLCAVARRLADQVGHRGMVCRLSGDEFMVVITQAGPAGEHALHLAAQLARHVEQPFDLDGRVIPAAMSIGVACSPQHGRRAELLMRHADAALYEAKRAGRRQPCLFSPPMLARLTEHERIRSALHQALQALPGGFSLLYQPQRCLAGGRIVAVEALLRWRPSAEASEIGPDRFIPVAEESGLIGPLGEWVLNEACRQALSWPDLVMSVNVSSVQFRMADFPQQVRRTLARSGLPAQRLELELTESVLIGHEDEAPRWLTELRAMGVRLAIDDFGTGYSSLSYLHRFPVHRLKIDRSFMRQMESVDPVGEAALVASILQIARQLGLETVAEGVESPATLARLTLMGCDAVQGHAIARPMPAEAMGRWLEAQSARPLVADASA